MLTHFEEEALVRWCSQLTIAGYPARHNVLQNMAKEIQRYQIANINTNEAVLVSYSALGINWTHRFLK